MDSSEEPIALTRRITTTVIVIVVVVAAASMGFKTLKAMRADTGRASGGTLPPLVRAQQARRGDYTEILRGFGRARALKRTTVVAEVDGVVVEIAPALEAGASLAAQAPGATDGPGTDRVLPIVVRIDDRDLDDQFERARADALAASADFDRIGTLKGSLRERLAVATEELDAAERELERITPLVPRTLTPTALDAQRLQVTMRRHAKLVLESQIRENADSVRAAEARLAALERGVALAERRKGRALVRAPFGGRIEARHVNLGQRVRVGDPLFTIVDLSRVEVPVALPATRYEDVVVGARATLHLPESDTPLHEGSVGRVAPEINPGDRTFFVYVIVPGTPSHSPAPPGAHLVARIHGRTYPGVIAVPRRAFLGKRLFAAKPSGEDDAALVEERTPTIERFLAGAALVSAGLEDGELFIVTNLESIANGSRVRLAPEAK